MLPSFLQEDFIPVPEFSFFYYCNESANKRAKLRFLLASHWPVTKGGARERVSLLAFLVKVVSGPDLKHTFTKGLMMIMVVVVVVVVVRVGCQ